MKKKKAKAAKEKAKQAPPQPQETKDEGFDFGGIPQRDLKRNLACLQNESSFSRQGCGE